MKYVVDNKTINIPDEEIKKGIDFLGLSEEESIQMYLEDNGYLDNEEQIELNNIASTVKIEHGASGIDKTKSRKPSKPRTFVNADEKIMVYNKIKELLETIAEENGGKVEVLKNEKLLQLTLPSTNRPLKVDIIHCRPPKG